MDSTYIYGTPHGFNFYEGIASWNDYFKSFYISARRGKRLMINRRDSGVTVYSFLCYGLMEKEGRRQNGFFGYSVVLDDNKFSPDLKVLFEWFDYLFNKIVDRGNLFSVNKDGILQYKVDKFTDSPTDVDWLKSNLPNIFTKSSDISLLPYDTSYSTQNLGKIICRNIDTPIKNLISDFKTSHWIAISPDFALEEEIEEINFTDLNFKLNEYSQQILSAVANSTKDSLSLLKSIESECKNVIDSLKKYSRSTENEVEKENCRETGEKYVKVSDNLSTLIKKVQQDNSSVTEITTSSSEKNKTCVKCNRSLPPELFNDKHSNICRECSKTDPENRICKKCHSKKPVSSFTQFKDVCDDCVKTKHGKDWLERIKPIHLAAVMILIVIGISAVLVLKSFSSGEADKSAPGPEDVELEESAFDANKFNDLLNAEKYYEAYEYVISFDRNDEYIFQIKNSISEKISQLREKTTPYTDIAKNCETFTTKHMRVLNELGYDIPQVNLTAHRYQRLCEITSKEDLTVDERTEAMELIHSLSDVIDITPWAERINNMKVKQDHTKGNNATTVNDKLQDVTITIINRDKQDQNELDRKILKQSETLTYKEGTFVIVNTTPAKEVRINRSGTPLPHGGKKVQLEKDKPVTFTIGEIKITIKVKENGFQTV